MFAGGGGKIHVQCFVGFLITPGVCELTLPPFSNRKINSFPLISLSASHRGRVSSVGYNSASASRHVLILIGTLKSWRKLGGVLLGESTLEHVDNEIVSRCLRLFESSRYVSTAGFLVPLHRFPRICVFFPVLGMRFPAVALRL